MSYRKLSLWMKLLRRDARAFRHGLRYIQRNDWAWIHFKMAIGVLCPVLTWINTPLAVTTGLVQMAVMNAILIMLFMGGLVSIIGMLARGTRIRPLIVGYAIEMMGLIPLISGPILLAVIYAISAVNGNAVTWVGFSFCYALSAALFARYVDTHLHHLSSNKGGKDRAQGRS